MTTPTNPQEPLHAYVDWLLEIAAQLTVILEHMWRHHNPDAPESPRQVLNRLVRETIPPAWARREADLDRAADLIRATSDAIANDLFLVSDEPPFDPPSNGTEVLH